MPYTPKDDYNSATDADGDGDSDAGVMNWLDGQKKTLKEFLSDPKGFIIGTLALWIVNQVITFVEAVLGLVLSAVTLVASIPGMVGDAFGNAGGVISGAVFGVIGTLQGMAVSLVQGLGWTAPLIAALVVVAVLEGTEEFGPPVLSAASDLLGAIPVVGSLLDALLTFGLKLAASLGGDGS